MKDGFAAPSRLVVKAPAPGTAVGPPRAGPPPTLTEALKNPRSP